MGDKRVNWKVLGRTIGTGTGWDQLDTVDFIIYDFEPAQGISIPSGDLCVLYEVGKVEMYGDDGEVTFSADIVATLRDIPRAA